MIEYHYRATLLTIIISIAPPLYFITMPSRSARRLSFSRREASRSPYTTPLAGLSTPRRAKLLMPHAASSSGCSHHYTYLRCLLVYHRPPPARRLRYDADDFAATRCDAFLPVLFRDVIKSQLIRHFSSHFTIQKASIDMLSITTMPCSRRS